MSEFSYEQCVELVPNTRVGAGSDPFKLVVKVSTELKRRGFTADMKDLRALASSRPDAKPMCLMIDLSASMRHLLTPLIKGLQVLAKYVPRQVSIVGYSSNLSDDPRCPHAKLLLDWTDVTTDAGFASYQACVAGLRVYNSTCISDGVRLGLDCVSRLKPGTTVSCFLFTDGDANLGLTAPPDFDALIRSHATTKTHSVEWNFAALGVYADTLIMDYLVKHACEGAQFFEAKNEIELLKQLGEIAGGALSTVTAHGAVLMIHPLADPSALHVMTPGVVSYSTADALHIVLPEGKHQGTDIVLLQGEFGRVFHDATMLSARLTSASGWDAAMTHMCVSTPFTFTKGAVVDPPMTPPIITICEIQCGFAEAAKKIAAGEDTAASLVVLAALDKQMKQPKVAEAAEEFAPTLAGDIKALIASTRRPVAGGPVGDGELTNGILTQMATQYSVHRPARTQYATEAGIATSQDW